MNFEYKEQHVWKTHFGSIKILKKWFYWISRWYNLSICANYSELSREIDMEMIILWVVLSRESTR